MKTALHPLSMASLFVAIILSFGLMATPVSAVSDADLQEQKRVVLLEHIETIQAQFKLIQLTYIRYLENRIATLQTLVNAQS